VLGTDAGVVKILDVDGNCNRSVVAHTCRVADVSIDARGEYVASCSEDGKVLVTGLYDEKYSASQQFDRPVAAVALEPDYARSKGKRFVSGGRAGQLVMCEKSLFSMSRAVLHAGEGPIYSIKWRGNLIAWSNDLGVKVYDCTSKQRIAFIDRSKNSPRPDLYRCNLVWRTDEELLIGWANSVRVCKLQRCMEANMPSKVMQIQAMFDIPHFIAGIAPCMKDLAILSVKPPKPAANGKGDEPSEMPELVMVTENNEPVASDALKVNGFQKYLCRDYRLESMPDDNILYILCPKVGRESVCEWASDQSRQSGRQADRKSDAQTINQNE
jgi:vacuolar protein sorting-associated protein 41